MGRALATFFACRIHQSPGLVAATESASTSTATRWSAGLLQMAPFAQTPTSTDRIGQTVPVTDTPLRTTKVVLDTSETRSETNLDPNGRSASRWTTEHIAAPN